MSASRQQRRLQRPLDEHVVIAFGVARPFLVVVDAMPVVGCGAEEEHLRLVDGDCQNRDRIAGFDVLEVHLVGHAGLAIIDMAASATNSRCWLRYSPRQVTNTNRPDLPSFSTIDSMVRTISISSR